MRKWKVLNLYAGIGGNRKLWTDVDVTAVEIDSKIAGIYQDFFPDDKVVVGDAHEYLLKHFKEFDFIWSSPPCPTHSKVRKNIGISSGQVEPVYPDFKLYEEIVFLHSYFKGKFCVENVVAFYEPLITPFEFGAHWFWANFMIPKIMVNDNRKHLKKTFKGLRHYPIEELEKRKGFEIQKYSGIDKPVVLRNCVEPELGKHILDCARRFEQVTLDVLEE